MTVGMNTWECLQNLNDSNGASAGTAASSTAILTAFSTNTSSSASSNSLVNNTQYSSNTKNKIEKFEPVTVSSTLPSPIIENSNLISNINSKSNNNISNQNPSTNAHSLGSLKKARSGRNHAGAKYLASQYTQGKKLSFAHHFLKANFLLIFLFKQNEFKK